MRLFRGTMNPVSEGTLMRSYPVVTSSTMAALLAGSERVTHAHYAVTLFQVRFGICKHAEIRKLFRTRPHLEPGVGTGRHAHHGRYLLE